GLPRPTATTGTLLEKAIEHLISVDARLKPVVNQHHCHLFSPEGLAEQIDPFESLVSSIIGQQVSGAAARSIKNKFLDLFDAETGDLQADATTETKRRFPTPAQVAKLDIPTLRTAGLSQRKAEYIQGLAEKFSSGELSTEKLLRASDEEVMEMLIAVRGLGRWSVEMFSCFALKRTDVFSTGDLGVQRGCAAFVGRDVNKLKAKGGGKFKYMSENDMLELAEKFRPYRSLFMWPYVTIYQFHHRKIKNKGKEKVDSLYSYGVHKSSSTTLKKKSISDITSPRRDHNYHHHGVRDQIQ
ncbi:hypothetical protein F66182_14489, partial [Fusarium sp. NRRL 66182]